MAYFPIFIQLEGEDCLVAGGGKVAQRKVEILLEYGPGIRLVAPEVTARLRELGEQGKIRIFLRQFQPVSYTHLDVYKRQTSHCS